MADRKMVALRRNLEMAEASGDTERAKRLRKRLGDAETTQEPNGPADANPPEGLDAVQFASPAAKKAAEDEGLGADAFKRRRKSSEAGFTKADVERIAAATDEGDEESA